jgi:hypothetical protein
MDYADIITALIALVAVVVSLIALIRTRKFNERQITLQEETARLSSLQRQILERGEEERAKSDVGIYLYSAGTGYRFGIVNSGNVPVRNVDVRIEPKDGKSNPLVLSECERKLPVDEMGPGEEISLIAAISSDTGTLFTARLEWDAENGETHKKKALLSL